MAGIYIHIPFCHSKCAYCDFYSLPNRTLMRSYTKAIVSEIKLWLSKQELRGIVWDTAYIGGGTPSLLAEDELSTIVEAIPTDNIIEFTIECNPEDVTPEWVKSVKKLGINRVSIGIQSFIDSELKEVGRNHSSSQAVEALSTLKSSNITNVSADLIYGLPGQTIDSWKYSLKQLLEFSPEHISAYSLSYEPGTRLYARREAGNITEASDETIETMYNCLTSELSRFGYGHYEISNFSKPMKHSRHNSSYWNFVPYLGIGAAAHGYFKGKRYANPWNVRQYIDNIAAGRIIANEESLSIDDIFNEYIMISLRTSSGTDFMRLQELTGNANLEKFKRQAHPKVRSGLLTETPYGVRIPEDKWLISDMIIRDLMI